MRAEFADSSGYVNIILSATLFTTSDRPLHVLSTVQSCSMPSRVTDTDGDTSAAAVAAAGVSPVLVATAADPPTQSEPRDARLGPAAHLTPQCQLLADRGAGVICPRRRLWRICGRSDAVFLALVAHGRRLSCPALVSSCTRSELFLQSWYKPYELCAIWRR